MKNYSTARWHKLTKILSIDPSSNKITTSTTGVVIMDNADLIYYESIPYGSENFKKWWHSKGKFLEFDTSIVEKFEARDSDYSRDNTVKQTIETIKACIPNIFEQRNAGYMQDVPDALLKALDLWKFDQQTHHNDIRAAARLALFYAMRTDMEDVVTEIGLKLERKLNAK